MINKNNDKLNYKIPQNEKEINLMYNYAYNIGRFFLYECNKRLDSYINWLEKCKSKNNEIRLIYSDEIYDFEIFLNNKWIKISKMTTKALLEELN